MWQSAIQALSEKEGRTVFSYLVLRELLLAPPCLYNLLQIYTQLGSL